MNRVYICAVLIPALAKGILKQPYGVMLCQRLCSHISECSEYDFDTTRLECCVNDRMCPSSPSTAMRSPLTSHHCRNSLEVFKCRAGIFVCAQHGTNVRGSEVNRENSHSLSPTRFLKFSTSPVLDKPLVQMFFLTNRTKQRYLLDWDGFTSAVAFIPAINSILFASPKSKIIYSVGLDKPEKIHFKKDINCTAIAADDNRKLLFLASVPRQISVMTLGKEEIRNIYKPERDVDQMIVDVRNKALYIRERNSLYKVSYDGEILASFGTRFSPPLDINVEEEMIFFVEGSHIMKMSLATNTSMKVMKTQTMRKTQQIVLAGDDLYLFGSQNIMLVSVDKKFKSRIVGHGRIDMTNFLVCGIP